MKIGSMFGDILSALVHRPATEKYPYERHAAPERLRGALWFKPETCTGCGICIKDCPANAVELITLDKKAKRFVLRYHVDRCTFCAQCVKSCNNKCLGMSNEQWELAQLNKKAFILNYGQAADIQACQEQPEQKSTPPPATT